MKKTLSLLVALALLLCATALAEAPSDDVIDRFSDTWVDDGIAVEIWYDVAFQCHVVLGDGGDESDVCEYGECRYDAGTDSLICTDGVRTHESYDGDGGELNSEVLAEGLSAEFRFIDGMDRLCWDDSEGLGRDHELQRLSDEEEEDYNEGQAYVGRWDCGSTCINIIDLPNDSYIVKVISTDSCAERVEWAYRCAYYGDERVMRSFEPGTKTVVTYDENGFVDSTTTAYTDGTATFTMDDDNYILTWSDEKENAGENMQFIEAQRFDYDFNCLMAEGSFVIQVDVMEDYDNWHAFDMAQDDSVVILYDADVLDDTFVARYDPVGDGDVTVGVWHTNGVVCDELITWDLHVEDGEIQEVTNGSYTQSPDEYEQNEIILGDWVSEGDSAAGMTIAKNEESGWALQIRMSGARVLDANIYYDCELDRFVYAGGTVHAAGDTGDAEPASGDVVASDAGGSLSVVPAEGWVRLAWVDDANAQESVLFHRPEGWGEKTIHPMFDGLDLENGTYPMAFDRSNVADGAVRDVHIYSDDCYDIVDIEQMAPGDWLEVSGESIMVDTLGEDEYGNKTINGGYENGGVSLCAYDGENCWMITEDDDYHSYTERAVETLEMDENVVFTDDWKGDSDPEVFKGIKDVTEAIRVSEDDEFIEYNTLIELDSGKIVKIDRHFIP